MPKINVLDIAVANLIAAGEVVDRPSSVVKELLENAIDAGADVITVETRQGGSAFIRVTDNGCGMAREDVPICIQRHATSKIRTEKDLDGILTLGFRGEALAAIAAVSKLRIMTKVKDRPLGTLMRSENGTVMEINEIGCPEGTTVIAEELLANVPARRKFLKRDSVETMAICAVVEKIALSRPDLSIRLICDGASKFATAGDGKLQSAVYAVLGREFAKKLIAIDCTTEGIGVTGFIGSPDNVRGNRNVENFFINGRYVRSKTVQAALEQAFESYIPSDRFPVCILYLTIHPSLVDVNVHPAKLEVKFSSEQPVFNAVYCAVRNALTEKVRRPEMKLGQTYADDAVRELAEQTAKEADEVRIRNAFVPMTSEPPLLQETVPTPSVPEREEFEDHRVTPERAPEGLILTPEGKLPDIPELPEDAPAPREEDEPLPQETPDVSADLSAPETSVVLTGTSAAAPAGEETPPAPAEEKKGSGQPEVPQYIIRGEVWNTYLVIEQADRMLLVDKHAAHERILFEEMKRIHRERQCYTQNLLIPLTWKLSPMEFAAACEFREDILATGFEFTADEAASAVSVTAYPADFRQDLVQTIFTGLVGQLADGTTTAAVAGESRYERALYQASCKAAVKGGELNDPAVLRWICDRLMALPDIRYCPHGRPVAFEITRSAMERQFGRTR